jgi:hypothetical protein
MEARLLQPLNFPNGSCTLTKAILQITVPGSRSVEVITLYNLYHKC